MAPEVRFQIEDPKLGIGSSERPEEHMSHVDHKQGEVGRIVHGGLLDITVQDKK